MTIHVLHAGDGYLYLIRSVAAHDGQLAPGASLAAYYTATGQPPGHWSGEGARRLAISGVVTEEQMRSLFGEGMHPNASTLQAAFIAGGMSKTAAAHATRLGRRFPRYGNTAAIKPLARRAYKERGSFLGRPLTDEEKLEARQEAAAREFEQRTQRAAVDPVELEALGQGTTRREAVAGYDLVFTPVKSVAALWGLGSDATRQQIFEAHEAAVADALDWIESNIALTRTGNRGQAQINTLGLIAAQFHHWDSRAGDPDLHTHVAISNKVQGPDEKWRSLDGRALFAAAVSVSERYNTRIEDELRTRLGITFEERAGRDDGRRPVREVVGMPQAIIDAFSKRRHGIEQQYQELLRDYQDRHGHDPGAATRHALYQQATLRERPEKVHGRSLQQMVASWQQEATTVLGTIDAATTIETLTLHSADIGEAADVPTLTDNVLDALTSSRATWNVHHLRAEAHRQSRNFHAADRDHLIEAIVASATSPARSIEIATPGRFANQAPYAGPTANRCSSSTVRRSTRPPTYWMRRSASSPRRASVRLTGSTRRRSRRPSSGAGVAGTASMTVKPPWSAPSVLPAVSCNSASPRPARARQPPCAPWWTRGGRPAARWSRLLRPQPPPTCSETN